MSALKYIAGISSERIYISIIDTGLNLLGRVLNLQKFEYFRHSGSPEMQLKFYIFSLR
jgi:hypothetical protein